MNDHKQGALTSDITEAVITALKSRLTIEVIDRGDPSYARVLLKLDGETISYDYLR